MLDLETCELLIDNNKILHGLFWCHLVIEKALKAHYVKTNKSYAPKTHNLVYLSNKTNLILTDSHKELIGVLLNYQLEVRYPEYKPVILTIEKAKDYLNSTRELFLWLIEKL